MGEVSYPDRGPDPDPSLPRIGILRNRTVQTPPPQPPQPRVFTCDHCAIYRSPPPVVGSRLGMRLCAECMQLTPGELRGKRGQSLVDLRAAHALEELVRILGHNKNPRTCPTCECSIAVLGAPCPACYAPEPTS